MSVSVRTDSIAAISDAVRRSSITIIRGERGLGQKQTTIAALSQMDDWTAVVSDGDWFCGGYLAGLQTLIDGSIAWSLNHSPDLVKKYQQTLKRLYPLLDTPHFTVPKDLTNISSKDERTRFYHYEYQNKLLVGLSEFLIEINESRKLKTIIVIDRASGLSPTAVSLVKVMSRLDRVGENFRFILIDYDRILFFDNATEISFDPCDLNEINVALKLNDYCTPEKAERIYTASAGNLSRAKSIVECDRSGITVVGYIDSTALIDLYLSTKSQNERHALLVKYIEDCCNSEDPIAMRNYETFDSAEVDKQHLRHHTTCMAAYHAGTAPLVTLHAQMLRDKWKRLEALAEPSEILKSIGLYDTWFSYFAELFADTDLRQFGSGSDAVNAVFINAAFVLYSLGCGVVSVPYLEEFYQRFPLSRYTPTVLYAQSMTYGRYQQPVNLPLAEEYAIRNLQIIEDNFKNYDKYHYIKVFAENAYAYIKARQGKYDEALALCTEGNRKMLDVYGDSRFKLHQSILIYNTSQIYEIVKNYELAEKQLRLAIHYDPYYGEYHNDLGNLLSKIGGRETEALEAYARAIELCPPYYEAHINRGVLLARQGENEKALADFARALVIKPQEPRALIEAGNVHMLRSDWTTALEAYQAAATIEPKNPDLQSNLGLAYSELGSQAESIDHYKRAIALQPRHALSHNNLAIELFNMDRIDEALVHANIAVDIGGDPDYEDTRNFIQKGTAA